MGLSHIPHSQEIMALTHSTVLLFRVRRAAARLRVCGVKAQAVTLRRHPQVTLRLFVGVLYVYAFEVIVFDFERVHVQEKVVIMLQKRNSIEEVLERVLNGVRGARSWELPTGAPGPWSWQEQRQTGARYPC